MAEVDIATLGIKVDANGADVAAGKLDNLTNAGERAEKGAKGVSSATNEMKAAIMAAIGAINANTNAMGQFSDRLNNTKTASRGAAAAVDDMESRVSKLRATVDPMGAAMNKVNMELAEAKALFEAGAIGAAEYQRQITILNARSADFGRRQLLMNEAMGIGARSARLQAHETLNLSRQFADIGVTAAMGMNPIMIAIQQGPQIADVLQTARSRGISAASAFKQMGEGLLPFLRYISLIGGAAAIAFGIMGLAAHGASENVGNVQKELDLTDKQMDRLKDKGTDLGYTMGDVFAGIAAAAADMIGYDEIAKNWDNLLDYLGKDALGFVKDVVGIFGGMTGAIKASFADIPGSIAAVFQMAIIEYLKFINDLMNRATNVINNFRKWAHLDGGENLVAWHVEVPKMSAGAAKAAGSLQRGYNEGRDSAQSAFDAGMSRHRRNRITEDAGDPEKGRKGREHKPKKSDEEKDYESAVKGAESYIKALQKETEAIGKNQFEIKQLNTEREAGELMAKANATGNAANIAHATQLTTKMREETEKWVAAQNAEGIRKYNEQLHDQAVALRFEQSLIGKSAEERARLTKAREIDLAVQKMERDGYQGTADAIREQKDALVDLAGATARWTDMADAADRTAQSARDMANGIKDATASFGDLFGAAGEGFSQLMDVIFDFNAQQEESQAALMKNQSDYNQGLKDRSAYEYDAARIQQNMAQAQINSYGNMLGAAKHFFKEGSTGWRVMEAAERAYRIFQFAMQLRAMVMDTAHTAKSVANSGARAAADGVAAVAKAIASLPFPLNLIAGAATIAFLVAIGVKLAGKGGGKGASASAGSSQTDKVDKYTGPTDSYGAPTSYYSVLRPGDTTVAGNRSAPGYMQNGVQVSGGDINIHIEGDMADNTLAKLGPILDQHQQQTVDASRQAVAADMASRAGRQVLSGA